MRRNGNQRGVKENVPEVNKTSEPRAQASGCAAGEERPDCLFKWHPRKGKVSPPPVGQPEVIEHQTQTLHPCCALHTVSRSTCFTCWICVEFPRLDDLSIEPVTRSAAFEKAALISNYAMADHSKPVPKRNAPTLR